MNRRLVRLYNDYKEVTTLLCDHPTITISSVKGDPPEIYEIEYKILGLEQNIEGIVNKETHLCEIVLPVDYPATMPICRMLTPVFHPNISPGKICIADHWAAGESLVGIIIRIGEMICYQNYNIKSPLNGEAAKWAESNIFRFPLDQADLNPRVKTESPVMTEGELAEIRNLIEQAKNKNDLVEKSCANCGAKSSEITISECSNGHVVCFDCMIECGACKKKLCVLCSFAKCTDCRMILCDECKTECSECQSAICKQHILNCSLCGKVLCSGCSRSCSTCDSMMCQAHFREHQFQPCRKQRADDQTAGIPFPEPEKNSIDTGLYQETGKVCQKCGYRMANPAATFCEMCGTRLAD